MNRYIKNFLHRGMLFGGFGPIISGIVYLILSKTVDGFTLSGGEVLVGIISTYLLAFLHAGASVFNQIEHWSPLRQLACHFSCLYISYAVCYTVNSWIPFEPLFLLIFTGVFILTYLAIYLTVALIVKTTERRLNSAVKGD